MLARDDDDGSEESALCEATLEIRLPEGMVETVGSESSAPNELPMLDELSPLDGLGDQGIEAPANEIPELDASLEEPGETELTSPDEVFPDSSEPKETAPELVADIIEVEDLLEIDEPADQAPFESEEVVPEVLADVLEM